MKILLIHNFYRPLFPSGEDVIFKNELELLKRNGEEIIIYNRYNEEISTFSFSERLKLPIYSIWSRKTYKEIFNLIKREKPDIAHFHNIFYLISPAGYYACNDAGIPVVQTLHNYRFFCINGLFLRREGKICQDCIGKFPWRGVLRRCFRNSFIYSAGVCLIDSFHHAIGTWECKVDAFISLNKFCKEVFLKCGLPEKKIFVKPNFLVEDAFVNYIPDYSHKNYIAYLGRLSFEKGVHILIEAWKFIKRDSLKLKIIGYGPMKEELEKQVCLSEIKNIEFIVPKDRKECFELLKNAMFIVVPSIWLEPFGMVVLEAFACGKPVIGSKYGALPELIQHGKTGLIFDPEHLEDLSEKINWLIEHEEARTEMGENARIEFETRYTAAKNYDILMEIYNQAIANKTQN